MLLMSSVPHYEQYVFQIMQSKYHNQMAVPIFRLGLLYIAGQGAV